MSNYDQHKSQLFNSREILLDQLEEAGYEVAPHRTPKDIIDADVFVSMNELKGFSVNHSSKQMKAHVKYVTNVTKKHISTVVDKIILSDNVSNNDKELFEYTDLINNFNVKTDTLVYLWSQSTEPSSAILDYLQHLYITKGVFVVIRTVARTQYNVLKHIRVPHYEILNDTEEITNDTTSTSAYRNMSIITNVPELLRRYKITVDKLPTESRFSPTLSAKLVRPGQIVCYYRPSPTAMVAPHYVRCT